MVLANNKLRAWIRTVVPGLWSTVLTIVATRLHAHLTVVETLATALGGLGVWSAMFHKLEARFKWASFFLGALPFPTKIAVPLQYHVVPVVPIAPVVEPVVATTTVESVTDEGSPSVA